MKFFLCFILIALSTSAVLGLPSSDPAPEASTAPSAGVSGAVSDAPVLTAPGKITVGIVSAESREDFDSKIAPFFKDQWSKCGNCELKNLSTYDDKGKFNEKAILSQIQASPLGVTFLFFNVNWRFKAEDYGSLVEALKKITTTGTLVVGSTGYPKEGESSAPITRTVLGQIPDMVLVGEMNERERLLTTSFFGPEMLTAVKPPKDLIGKGLGPSYFVAKLAQNYSRRLPQDWLIHFRTQKLKSRKIWPAVEDFFPR
jgi:hypothetical protein